MESGELENLIRLREQISDLTAVKCRINHERVRIDGKSGLPISREISEIVFDRIGLCSADVRAKRISCGHTMSRYILEEALTVLESENAGSVQILRDELNDLTNKIHMLDLQKGDAEKRLAELIEKKHHTPESFSESDFDEAAEQIKLLEQKHSSYVDQIETVRENILYEIQLVIDQKVN